MFVIRLNNQRDENEMLTLEILFGTIWNILWDNYGCGIGGLNRHSREGDDTYQYDYDCRRVDFLGVKKEVKEK